MQNSGDSFHRWSWRLSCHHAIVFVTVLSGKRMGLTTQARGLTPAGGAKNTITRLPKPW